MDLQEEDILDVVDADGDAGDVGDDGAASEMADEEQTEEALEDDTPKLPRGPDTSLAQLRGHTSSVFAVAVSPDGELVATGGGDDVGILWVLATQAQVAVLRGHTDSVVAVAWNAAGTMLATGSLDSTVRVWDRSGTLLHAIEGPSAEVEWVAWHPKGDVLLAGSDDGTAWMWHVVAKPSVAPVCMTVFAGHDGEVACGEFAGAAGKLVVTGSADGSARLWNPKSGRCIQAFEGLGWSDAPINTVACSQTVRMRHEAATGKGGWVELLAAILPHPFFRSRPQRPLLVAGGQDGVTRLASLSTFKLLGALSHGGGKDKDRDARAVEGSRGGAGGLAGVAVIAPASGGSGAGSRRGGAAAAAAAAAAAGEGVPDDEGEEEEGGEDAGCSVESVAFCESDTHPWVASGATDGSVLVWDLNNFAVRQRLEHEEAVVKVAWCPLPHAAAPAPAPPTAAAAAAQPAVAPPPAGTSTLLVVATADGCLRVWDGRDGACLANHTGHAGIILDFAFVSAQPPLQPSTAAAAADDVATTAAAAAAEADKAEPAAKREGGGSGGGALLPRSCPLVVTAGDDGVCRIYALDLAGASSAHALR